MRRTTGDSVTLVVGDDFDTAVDLRTDTRVGGSEIDTNDSSVLAALVSGSGDAHAAGGGAGSHEGGEGEECEDGHDDGHEGGSGEASGTSSLSALCHRGCAAGENHDDLYFRLLTPSKVEGWR